MIELIYINVKLEILKYLQIITELVNFVLTLH